MPPSGPRSRPSQAPPPARGANVRNEAFENIFGRPSVAHHQPHDRDRASGSANGGPGIGAQPSLPPGQNGYGGYGYHPGAPGPPGPPGGGPSGGGFLAPGAPSYPPGSSFGPPPPRGAPSFPPVFAHHSGQPPPLGGPGAGPGPRGHELNGYGRGGFPPPPSEPNMGRRTSVANSTHSSSSYYSPQPDPSPNPAHAGSHFGSASGYPAPPGSSRQPSMKGARPQPTLLTPAPYPPSSYDVPSPASAVFPHRGVSQAVAGGSSSNLSLPGTSSNPGSFSRAASVPSLHAQAASGRTSRPTPERRDTDDRMRSPPPDYTLAMGNLHFDGSGGGPLDNVPGIPRRGEMSDLGNFVTEDGRRMSQERSAQGHRRMASDSSLASSGGYTMTSMSGMTSIAYVPFGGANGRPLSRIPGHASPAHDDYSSPNTPTGSEGGFAFPGSRHGNRKSMDSTISLPLMNSDGIPTTAPSMSSAETRATSFSGGSINRKDLMRPVRSDSSGHTRPVPTHSHSYGFPTPLPSNRSLTGTLNRSHSSARAIALQSLPQIYPALLSKVAEAFKQLITIGELTKDGISYKDSFDGRTAVSIIAEIIKTPDRNLALLLGRALDSQKFFHDVTYDHRLRDNPTELYQFKERLAAPFVKDPAASDSPRSDHVHLGRTTSTSSRPSMQPITSESSSLQMSDSQTSWTASTSATPATSTTSLTRATSSPRLTKLPGGSVPMGLNEDGEESEEDLPTGVFTLLTDCYSPTCSRENLCYSINCPRRLEQMKRLNMKPTGLSRKLSNESIHDDSKPTGTLWIESVSQEILDSVSDTEKKRQEAINEVIYTERDFVRDLEYLRDSWVKPLLSQDIIGASHREDFVRQVFWNVHDVLGVNHVLAERLTRRQKQQPVVSTIGDLFLERVPLFEPFVTYGAHQLFGKYEFEKEKEANLAFKKFVDETERKPESRKLELNGYLTKPTTRLGRYPLLLEAVLKYTADDSPDKKDLPEVIKAIKGYLGKVNTEAAKSENIFELAQLEQQLVFRPNETIDLRLRDKNRELVHKGQLKRRGGNRDEIADLMGFLFDHAFLLVKPKWVNKAEQYRVYRRPIPLELLVVMSPDDSYGKLSTGTARSKLMARPSGGGRSNTAAHVPPKPESKHGFSLTIVHLGKKGYSMQLWVDTYMSRKKWLEAIDKQQTILRDRSCVFQTETITEGYFHGLRRINCVSPYDQGNRMIYGTDEGVYFSNLRDDKLREPVKVINLLDVTQVDVIEEYQLLIVLHERSVSTFPLDCLDPNDPNAALKRGKKISSHTSFFKSGLCLGKMLVAVVKSSTLSSTIKVLEPIDQSLRGKKQQGSFMKRLNGQNDALKLFKEFYIPTESSSVHFLRTKLCVACTKGFEIVDLETLDMQGLLDPSDASLDFVLKRDNVRPIAIYRIEEDFLLCYDEFAFYVNKTGWRSRPKWAIIWEGVPTAFALQYPYVIAFEPTFIEVHSVDTGHLVQIIPANNISCLFADTPPSRVNAPMALPNRQWHYPPSAGPGFRPPPGHPGAPGFPPSAYPAPGAPSGGYFNHGQRPPPMGPPGQFGGMPPPQPAPNRFLRNQVIFTTDDGHVQFLKLPPPGVKLGPGPGPGPGPSGSSHPGHAPRPSY